MERPEAFPLARELTTHGISKFRDRALRPLYLCRTDESLSAIALHCLPRGILPCALDCSLDSPDDKGSAARASLWWQYQPALSRMCDTPAYIVSTPERPCRTTPVYRLHESAHRIRGSCPRLRRLDWYHLRSRRSGPQSRTDSRMHGPSCRDVRQKPSLSRFGPYKRRRVGSHARSLCTQRCGMVQCPQR